MLGYLLDTHSMIWLLSDPNKLSNTVKNIIQNPQNNLYYSPLSFSEMAIKVSTGKLDMANGWQTGYQQLLNNNNIQPCYPTWQDAIILQNLPFHHRDPFDRMLISCAITNDLVFISKDRHCALYDLPVIW